MSCSPLYNVSNVITYCVAGKSLGSEEMAAPQKRQQVFAPLKGSFPIDHFKECDLHYQNYITCLQEHRNDTAKCRAQTKDYMQ